MNQMINKIVKKRILFNMLFAGAISLQSASYASEATTTAVETGEVIVPLNIVDKKETAATGAEISTIHMDLGELFRFYGSDKDKNGYTSLYHTLFNHLKNQPITMLEIGIGTMIPNVHSSMVGYASPGYKPGGSLRAWRDYFSKGTIYGVDVQPDTQFTDEARITTFIGNSTDEKSVNELMKKVKEGKFDIILDDGSHFGGDQLKTLANFYPYLKENGIYIIEDVTPQSQVSKDPKLVSKICNGDPIFFVGLYNNLCVIYKNHLNRPSNDYSY